MKPANFIIRIPEPCNEDWNKMQPDAKGKFCNSCHKSVFDFSNKTDDEIRTILIQHKDQKVCGHFKKSQVDRPLNITINIHDLPRNMSITKMFGIALFIVFGTLLFSCTDEKGAKIDRVEIIDTSENRLTGIVPPPVAELIVDSVISVSGEASMMEPESYYQNMVAGGISYEEVPIDTPPPLDSIPAPKEQVLGGMVMYTIDDDTITPVDSTISNDFKKITEQVQTPKTNEFTVYPNPSNGEFTVKYELLKRSDVKITIFNITGALVKSIVNVASQYEGQYQIPVNLNELPNGIYSVSFIKGGTQSIEKIVIAR